MRNIDIALKKIVKIIDKIGDKPIRYSILSRMLNQEFKSMSVRFRCKKSNRCSLSGYYAGDIQEENERRYNVLMNYDNDIIPVNYLLNHLIEILYVMIHEFRHGYQYSRRPKKERYCRYKNDDDQFEYLSDQDELDAYAYGAAYQEMLEGKGGADWIINRYRDVVSPRDPKLYHRFLSKVYKFSQEYYGNR